MSYFFGQTFGFDPPPLMKFGTVGAPHALVGDSSGFTDSFDMRTAFPGLITPGLYQGSCNSCWAFATTGAVSDAIRIANRAGTSNQPSTNSELGNAVAYPNAFGTNASMGPNNGTPNNISPVYFDACSTGLSSDAACQQLGDIGAALGKLEQPGNYVSIGCRLSNGSQAGTFNCEPEPGCTQYSIVPGSSQPLGSIADIQQSLRSGIPVPTAMAGAGDSAFQTFWSRGGDGIYPQSQDQVDHAVVILGWGTENGQDYWIIRNSWGVSNDNGCFKMSRGGPVETHAYTFQVAAIPDQPPTTPVQPPTTPPTQPPVQPPTQPPTTPPTQPPITPVQPPIQPPTTPPIQPPVGPDQPVDPIVQPN